jgi:hypothetical protein
MSDDILTSDEDSDTSPKALRDALEKANKELREYKKLAEQAEAEKRTQSLQSILKAKGLKESAASHYKGDVSEEAVANWAKDLGLLNEEDVRDENADNAQRAAELSGGSQSLLPSSPNGKAPIIGDPHKLLELVNSDGFTYEQGVSLGIFPKDPNTV